MTLLTVIELAGTGPLERVSDKGLLSELRKGKLAPNRVMFGIPKDIDGLKGHPVYNDLPSELTSAVGEDLNGLYGSDYSYDANGNKESYDLWCSFKIKRAQFEKDSLTGYHWQQVTLYVRWFLSTNRKAVLCLDAPEDLKSSLKGHMETLESHDFFEWLVVFINEVSALYDKSVWEWRDVLRPIERSRNNTDKYEPKFPQLSELLRHVVHSNEVIGVGIDTITALRQDYELFCTENSSAKPLASERVRRKLASLENKLKAIQKRSISLQERLTGEINLAFNLVSQRNTDFVCQMTEHARSDNNIMKTIAIVSLIYLPGTFVSGVFGMSFFELEPQPEGTKLLVSDKIWVYFAVTIPLTLATVIIWVALHYTPKMKQGFGFSPKKAPQSRLRTNENWRGDIIIHDKV